MNRKVANSLTATLIVSQMQGVTFAQNINHIENINISNEQLQNEDSLIGTNPEENILQEENENSEDISNENVTNEDTSNEDTSNEKNENIEMDNDSNTIEIIEENYTPTGKLELDINFSTPISYTTSDKTNMSVILKQADEIIDIVEIGSENVCGEISSKLAYRLEALNSKRTPIEEGEDTVSFYHLTFENIQIGKYTVEIVAEGYQTVTIDNIDIETHSKRVSVGSANKVFLAGDVNADGAIDNTDYKMLKKQMYTNKFVEEDTKKFDLNRDSLIDISDLSAIHQNLNKVQASPVVKNTDIIVNPDYTYVELSDTTTIIGGNEKDILKNNRKSLMLQPVVDDGEEIPPISEDNPISFNIDLTSSGVRTTSNKVEQIVIKSPAENSPLRGSIEIPGAGESGNPLVISYNEDNIFETEKINSYSDNINEIRIDLGKQVAVSQITINVTGTRDNKNLTEISQVEFLNNVYKETPKPTMNIPVINKFTTGTSVGNEHMVIGWNHEPNVTGYELKVEELDAEGNVVKTSKYKTSDNTLKIEGVKGYAIYRVSIQSLSGDSWSSGYKDSENYNKNQTGSTNLDNNSNDKDGVPDNVDANYNPKGWNSFTGALDEEFSAFGSDSIVELQVIPEGKPEAPEGISVKGLYKGLDISWKSHKKAQDYDLYYRKVGDNKWIKANDTEEPLYKDSDIDNDVPDGVENVSYNDKSDSDKKELIRDTKYTITGLEDKAIYEIKMTATNHHGTGKLSQSYLGKTVEVVAPVTSNYKLINTSKGENETTNHIEKVEYAVGTTSDDNNDIVDNDYATSWEYDDWHYGNSGPIVTFDKAYTIKEIKAIKRLDVKELTHSTYIDYYDEETKSWKSVNAKFVDSHKDKVINITLEKPITAKKIRVGISTYPKVEWDSAYRRGVSISELKFYQYDSLEEDVESLFKDDLMLELSDEVTQEKIDELTKRARTIDSVNLEYHPKQTQILSDLQRAQSMLEDVNLKDKIISIDPNISNVGNTIGQANSWQSLGVAVKPGDKVNIYIGSSRKDTSFNLAISQHNGESSNAYKIYNQKLTVGKNEIIIPETGFDMNVEKGGNLYINFASNYDAKQLVNVRVSGGTEIPHLNLNNLTDDITANEDLIKYKIKTYIKELKSYANSLPNRYPKEISSKDNANNIYKYDEKTSILNTTEIEGDRITLSLPATQVLKGIEQDASTEEAQVNKLYENILAWEQLMKISYAQQGLLEEPIDFDGNGKIESVSLDELNGESETEYFNRNKAPMNRINVKYQRMFTGAFMYASNHHIGVGYDSVPALMNGVPFKYDNKGNLVNKDKAGLFGWGISHEIGHVHDITGLTYAEVTNNILALITQTFDDEDKSRIEDSSYEKVYDRVTSESVGTPNGLLGLSMFWQLHLAYDEDYTYTMLDKNTDNNLDNDTFYAKLYRATRYKGIANDEAGYDQVAQTYIRRASDAVEKDLRDFFEKWGLVASPETNKYLDEKGYEKETRPIYYLNDNARRKRLKAINSNNMSSIQMAEDTNVIASFGDDSKGNRIKDGSYLNQKEIPMILSVDKDSNKILGYEIIRKEATATGIKEVVVGFVENNQNGVTEYVDVIDSENNKVLEYKVRAYDYDLNCTEVKTLGAVKVKHDGRILKKNWSFDTNTIGKNDVVDENSGHGQVENGSINKIKDNNKDTVYYGTKAVDKNGQELSGDPYITIDMGENKQIVGLKYTPDKNDTKSKFNLLNLFKKNKSVSYDSINRYEVLVSVDGQEWTKAHSGKFSSDEENTIYFNEEGNNDNDQLWAYNVKYVKLVAKGADSISIAELDILAPVGDNIEIGTQTSNNKYTNGIGKLEKEFIYESGKSIPKGSIVITGEYKGDPAFNIPLVLNENDENFAIESQVILLANLPEDSQVGEISKGSWVYWITPEQQEKMFEGEYNIKGNSVKAELYRYNKLNEQNKPVGQRLVSDTFLVNLPENLNNLPTIDLTSSNPINRKANYNTIIEVNREVIRDTINIRNK